MRTFTNSFNVKKLSHAFNDHVRQGAVLEFRRFYDDDHVRVAMTMPGACLLRPPVNQLVKAVPFCGPESSNISGAVVICACA